MNIVTRLWRAVCERVGEMAVVQDYLIHRRLRAIRREFVRHEENTLREYKRLKSFGATWAQMHEQHVESMIEREDLEIDMQIEHSVFLTRIARQRQIPYPLYSDIDARARSWIEDEFSKRVFLKPAEQALLLTAIRKDLKEEAETFRSWAALGLGLFGTVTGSLALLLKLFGLG